MKVYFMMQYANLGSSSKYRVLIYRECFDKAYTTRYSFFWPNIYISKYMGNKKKYLIQVFYLYITNLIKRIFEIIFIVPKYEVLFIQRCIIPCFKPTFIKYLHWRRVKIIYDIDDALHLEKKYNCDKIAKDSDVICCGSRELKKHYKKINSNVFLVPTIDNDIVYTNFLRDTFQNKCIGWIGSNSTIKNLEIVVKSINKICEKHPNVYLKVISAESQEYEKLFSNFKFVKWKEETYIREMSEFTIGIMPLYDNEFNRGKCGFKLVQYLALEKPVIATDCGENKSIVAKYGYICSTHEEWEQYIETMLFDKNTYYNFLSNIRKDFKSDYGFYNVFEKLCKVIDMMKRTE